MAIEMIYYDKLIKNSQLIDPNTGILNILFIQCFREELERSRDFELSHISPRFPIRQILILRPASYR